jgi:hypothetical protein
MHMMVLSIWLLVEANYQINKNKSNDTKNDKPKKPPTKNLFMGVFLALASGLALGASISTRYPVALVVIAPILFLFAYYIKQTWPLLKKIQVLNAIKESKYMFLTLLFFILGLLIIIAPLMNYNNEYFGGSFKSGYDATPVNEFRPEDGLAERNQSVSWSGSSEGKLDTIVDNFYDLTPVFLSRMPCLLFLPFGIVILRKSPYLFLLLPWIIIVFLTYMSLPWVSMYANLMDVVWEPRYFMPALPAIAIFAAIAIDKIGFWQNSRASNPTKNPEQYNITGGVFAILIVFSLVFVGIVPAENHFQDLRELDEKGLPERPPPGPGPGPRPEEYIDVTTDHLILEPERFVETFVALKGANITRARPNGDIFWVRSLDANESEDVEVRMVGWSQEELDNINTGLLVDINGFFLKEEISGQQPRYYIGVKSDTLDFVNPAKI